PAGAAEEDRTVVAITKQVNEQVGFLAEPEKYENFYFEHEEQHDPLKDLAEHMEYKSKAIAFNPRLEWILERLQKLGAKRVLDVGIGNAYPSIYMAKNGIQIVGIDI